MGRDFFLRCILSYFYRRLYTFQLSGKMIIRRAHTIARLSRASTQIASPLSICTSNSRPPFRLHFCTSRLDHTQSKPRMPQMTLYTGTDCSLCDVAKEVLDQVKQEHAFELSLYNIRDDLLPDVKKWRRAYQYDIPVLHLEGKEIARHRLDKSKVIEMLREQKSKP